MYHADMTLLRHKIRVKKKRYARNWTRHWGWLASGFSVKPDFCDGNIDEIMKGQGYPPDAYKCNLMDIRPWSDYLKEVSS